MSIFLTAFQDSEKQARDPQPDILLEYLLAFLYRLKHIYMLNANSITKDL